MTAINVPLLDLKLQYADLRPEIEAVMARVAASQYFILGEEVAGLESEIASYCGTPHGVGCASGSDAIMLALLGLGIGPGDEVICPSYTFFATAGYIVRAGATPVFCDVDPVTYNMSADAVRDAAKKCRNLKAIMPVHLYGQVADMDAIMAVGKELGVPVVEDCAQAIGARDVHGRAAGSIGVAGCFSFFPTKNLGGFGDGGMVTCQDEDMAARMKMLRMHGMEPKYVHHIVGMNSRLDALQAAILRVKLPHLDRWSEGRQANAAFYDAAFAKAGASTTAAGTATGLPILTPEPAPSGARHIYNQYIIRVPAQLRDSLRAHMGENSIGSEIYYPIPLHIQKCFESLGYSEGDFPVSEEAARTSIALPIFPELTEAQLGHVASTIVSYVEKHAANPV